MNDQKNLKSTSIVFEETEYIIRYSKTQYHDVTVFDVTIEDEHLSVFTEDTFRISWLNTTQMITYPANGETDLDVKCCIIKQIFRVENIPYD